MLVKSGNQFSILDWTDLIRGLLSKQGAIANFSKPLIFPVASSFSVNSVKQFSSQIVEDLVTATDSRICFGATPIVGNAPYSDFGLFPFFVGSVTLEILLNGLPSTYSVGDFFDIVFTAYDGIVLTGTVTQEHRRVLTAVPAAAGQLAFLPLTLEDMIFQGCAVSKTGTLASSARLYASFKGWVVYCQTS